LPKEATRTRADREPYRDLLPSRRRAREEQRRDVHAHDQQQDADEPGHRHDLPRILLPERPGALPECSGDGAQMRRDVVRRRRPAAAHLLQQPVQFGARRGGCLRVAEPADQLERGVVAQREFGVH
jgi:hypothetical protein